MIVADDNSPFTSVLCLESTYVLALLTLGYGFDDESWRRIHFTDRVGTSAKKKKILTRKQKPT